MLPHLQFRSLGYELNPFKFAELFFFIMMGSALEKALCAVAELDVSFCWFYGHRVV